MKRLRILFYTITQGFTGLKKNLLMIFSSIYVIFVTLLLIGALSLLSKNLQNELNKYSDKPEMRIDCYSEISDSEALILMRKIEAHPSVQEITYISKEENLNKFLELLGEDSDLFQNYSDGANAFYVSFDVKLKDSSKAEQFVEAMFKVDGVEYVKDNISVVKTFKKIETAIKISYVVSILVLGTLSIFLSANTIRLTVVARKKNIEIMKYVGASHFYIEGPFVIEGIAIGLLGSLLSYFVLKIFYNMISGRVAKTGSELFAMLPFKECGSHFLTYFIIFGIAVGVLGSLVAIKRYEKV